MKRYVKWLWIPPLVFLTPIVQLIAIVMSVFLIANWHSDAERYKLKKEITTYVLEHKDAMERSISDEYERFVYTHISTFDGGVEYGYYYSKDNRYNGGASKEKRYKKGYRTNDVRGDPFDWYYTEKICDRWFYYEDHDG